MDCKNNLIKDQPAPGSIKTILKGY